MLLCFFGLTVEAQKVRRVLRFTEAAGGTTNKVARPIADADNTGSWTNTPLWSDLDDPVGSGDASWINLDAPTTALPFTVDLSEIADPSSGNSHIIRFRAAKLTSGGANYDAVVELRQGYASEASQGTLIATATLSGYADTTFSTVEYLLTTSEANSITDYSDLQFRCWGAKNGGGANRDVRFADMELETDITYWRVVQSVANSEDASGSTVAVTINDVATNRTLVAMVAWEGSDTTVVVSNGITGTFTGTIKTNNGTGSLQSFYELDSPAGNLTITAHWSAARTFKKLVLLESVPPQPPTLGTFTASKFADGSGTAMSSGDLTAGDHVLLVGMENIFGPWNVTSLKLFGNDEDGLRFPGGTAEPIAGEAGMWWYYDTAGGTGDADATLSAAESWIMGIHAFE